MIIGKIANKMISIKNHKFNPYRGYCKKKNTKVEATKGNILITIINGAYGHTFEGLYARKAMLQGNDVYILRCGDYLKHCDVINAELKYKFLRCEICQAQQKEFINAFGGHDCIYKKYVNSEDMKIIENEINNFFTTGIDESHYFRKVSINQILYSALQRYYLIAQPIVKDDEITRDFLYAIISTLVVMEKLCKEIRPKYVLSSHGTYSTWGAVVEYCKANNIYVITHGQNYNHCGIEFTYDDSYLTGVLNDKENKWNSKELSERERANVIRFLNERLGIIKDDKVAFDYNKNNKNHYTKEELCKKLGINPTKKIIGMFPNIPWDGQVTGGSTVFSHFKDWLKYTVDYFANKDDSVLVIRSHPAEILTGDAAGHETTASMLSELYSKLPNNVVIIEPRSEINSYTLGENSDFGITYSSTVSLELTYLGIPVILCGCPPFKDKNVVYDIASADEYKYLLDQGRKGLLVVDDDRKERLFRYLHYFFFMRTMPQTLVDIHDTVPQKYLFKNEDELNHDEVFEELYRCIENKQEMDFSRFY